MGKYNVRAAQTGLDEKSVVATVATILKPGNYVFGSEKQDLAKDCDETVAGKFTSNKRI